MDIKNVKLDLSQDVSKIEQLLEYFGFHSFSYQNNNLRCALPDGDNPSSVSIYLDEKLYGVIYTRGSFKGDIFHLIEYVTNRTLKDIFAITKTLFGYKNGKYRDLPKPSDLIDNYYLYKKDKELRERLKNQYTNPLYDISILDKFINSPHQELYQEAISPDVAKMFDIRYDIKRNRIIFPHFDWKESQKIVGIQGRIVGMSTDECNLLGIPKYWNYIKGYRKSCNLYGWHLAKDNVYNQDKLIIFESEKSVLKQFTREKGKGFSVALGGHELSNEQIRFIVNNTPVNCEIILAFDKDVMVKETNKLVETAKKLNMFRPTSYIFDVVKDNKLLGEKDSPIDKGGKIWNALYNGRIRM